MLLKRRRVVILAEAGSGKSTEFRRQMKIVEQSGSFSFSATVKESAERDFRSAMGSQAATAFDVWKSSEESAWIFLDSVDEAKVRGLELERALSSLTDCIAGADGRHLLLPRVIHCHPAGQSG